MKNKEENDCHELHRVTTDFAPNNFVKYEVQVKWKSSLPLTLTMTY